MYGFAGLIQPLCPCHLNWLNGSKHAFNWRLAPYHVGNSHCDAQISIMLNMCLLDSFLRLRGKGTLEAKQKVGMGAGYGTMLASPLFPATNLTTPTGAGQVRPPSRILPQQRTPLPQSWIRKPHDDTIDVFNIYDKLHPFALSLSKGSRASTSSARSV